MPAIHEVATLTSKGQITLPKSIRQALGADTDCVDVLVQIAAVRGAVHGLMMEVLNDHLDAHEHHTISKVAGLLHVTHGDYIAAKMRAKEAAQAH